MYCHKGVDSHFPQRYDKFAPVLRELPLLSEANNFQFKLLPNFQLVIILSKVLDEPISARHCA